jgi:hypothetical protein
MRLLSLSLTACLLLYVRSTAPAAEDENWTVLFNGKDLSGWRYGKEDLTGKTETADKRFVVRDGVIVAEPGNGIRDLYTNRPFDAEFHLKLEFRASAKSDSGVYIRGPQLQVRDFPRRGEQKQLKKFQTDGWNELDITVKNDQLLAKVNGKPLGSASLDLQVKDGKVAAKLDGKETPISKLEIVQTAIAHCLVNGEFLEDMPIPSKSSNGIGLQAETGKFEFRNIRVRERK